LEVAVLGEHTTTSPAAAYEILPQLLNRPSSERDASLLNAARAGKGFDCLIGKRGRNDHHGSAHAATGRTRTHPQPHAANTPAFQIGVAKSAEQLEAADKLIRRRYAWRGYSLEASEHAGRSEQDANLGDYVTFLAMEDAKVVGTITLRLDGPHGLRAEATHGDILQYARGEGRRLGELTRLALAEGADSRLVLSALFGLVYSVGRWVHNVTDVFIEVNPRHVAFYARALGFAIIGDARFCERVRAPSILLYADVDSLEERLGLAASAAAEALEPAQLTARDAMARCA
jgi:hypothetical protein